MADGDETREASLDELIPQIDDVEVDAEASFETNAGTASWQTIKPAPKSGWSFSARMTLFFALVAGLTAIILAVSFSFVRGGGFEADPTQALIIAVISAIIVASIIGWFASRSLVRPIRRITSTAAQIRNGDLSARTGLAGEDEIGRLGETFDDMATTLERDLDREHRLTSDVAHELRTPLMAMLATVEAMQDGVLPANDENFEIVASEVKRLSKHVDAMLHLSQVENTAVEMEMEATEMVSLVRNLVSSQNQLFHDNGLHLRFNDETSRGECYADVNPDLIREAIVNLMSNAFRYTSEGGWIVVSVAHSRGECRITVADTGIGIAKEDIPRTFSRFWRSDVSRERESGGLGVGLALTKEIIDRHNGTIRVESELGKGSTFIIRIPTHRGRRLPAAGHQERSES